MCNGWAKNACGGCLFCPGATRPPTAVPKALNEVTCSSEVLARRAISDAYGEGNNIFHGPKLLRFIFHDGVDYNNTVDVDGNPVTSESSGVDFCLYAGRKQWGQMEERQAHHSDPTHNQNLQVTRMAMRVASFIRGKGGVWCRVCTVTSHRVSEMASWTALASSTNCKTSCPPERSIFPCRISRCLPLWFSLRSSERALAYLLSGAGTMHACVRA